MEKDKQTMLMHLRSLSALIRNICSDDGARSWPRDVQIALAMLMLRALLLLLLPPPLLLPV